MKALVFAYHNMGRIGIEKLLDAGFEIPLVFTHEDNPQENVWFKSVMQLCRELSIEYAVPASTNTPEWTLKITEIAPDIIFSFYYRNMISPEILKIPPLGGYNLHGSYLPAYRGRCPVNWVIIRGEEFTGVTLHEMVEKPDAGPIVAQRKIGIAPDDTAFTLFKKLEDEAGALLDDILVRIRQGDIPKVPMDLSKGSYFGGRKPEDGRIHWNRPAREIYNLIRGVTRPYPGAFGFLGKKKVLFWRATASERTYPPPGIISVSGENVFIGTGDGCICPQEIEVESRVLDGRALIKFFKDYEKEQLS